MSSRDMPPTCDAHRQVLDFDCPVCRQQQDRVSDAIVDELGDSLHDALDDCDGTCPACGCLVERRGGRIWCPSCDGEAVHACGKRISSSPVFRSAPRRCIGLDVVLALGLGLALAGITLRALGVL